MSVSILFPDGSLVRTAVPNYSANITLASLVPIIRDQSCVSLFPFYIVIKKQQQEQVVVNNLESVLLSSLAASDLLQVFIKQDEEEEEKTNNSEDSTPSTAKLNDFIEQVIQDKQAEDAAVSLQRPHKKSVTRMQSNHTNVDQALTKNQFKYVLERLDSAVFKNVTNESLPSVASLQKKTGIVIRTLKMTQQDAPVYQQVDDKVCGSNSVDDDYNS